MGGCGVTGHGGNPAPWSLDRSGARKERKHLNNGACFICSRYPRSSLQRVPVWSLLLPLVLGVWAGLVKYQKARQGNGCPQPTLLFALR